MTTPSNAGGLIGNLLGGASGSLGGTNVLQNSIDQLTNAVNSLSNTISSSNFSGSGSLGQATRQQGQGSSSGFPSMSNPFQSNIQQPGIGGGGPGGAGNVSQPAPFGRSGVATMASAITAFGQNQMNPLLTLNQYATSSMLGMNTNGMSQNQAMQMLYRQAGMTSGNLNAIASSPQDAIASMQTLQQYSGSMNIGSNALGRAGLGAQAAFGMTNPGLGAASSAQLATALYSPQFSQNMLSMGYKPIRSMTPGGAPMNAGSAAQSILQGLGLNKMNPSNLYGNLSSGRGQASLSALFGSSGISNTQAATFLEGYNQLFSRGMNANQATQLFQQASSGSLASMKAAQSKLAKMGVNPADSDLQAMKTSQSVVTGRESMYAGGFNNAIQDSTGLLEKFNSTLTSILGATGLGGVLGYGGGMGGVLSGTSHAVGLAGTAGGLLSIGKMLGIGGGASGVGSALGGIGGGAAGSAALSVLSTAAVAAASALVLSKIHSFNPQAPQLNQLNQFMSRQSAGPGNSGSGWNSWSGLGHDITSLWGLLGSSHPATKGGGAASVPSTAQQVTGGNTQQGGISGPAKKAVGAAETQLGVPYVYGDEIPGVGFDCSGLVQWAYKQAGINLPRTSQAQWSALKNKRINLSQVREGDLVFTAGSDGTAASPGHVGLMINNRQLIQAPHSGANVQTIGYDPNAWIYAARPSGSGSFLAGGTSSNLPSATGAPGNTGNRGLSIGSGGTYGSANEADIINAMGGGSSGFSLTGAVGNGSSGSSNTITGGGSTAIPKNAGNSASTARLLARQYGWSSGSQWQDFLRIVNHEDASWNPMAVNSASGAYGIPQALPGDKMASAGADWKTNPATQLKWMFGYIKDRYGTPSNAWSHEQQLGWYGAGGQLSVVGERGPELMMQTPGGGTQVFSNAQTMAFINAIKGSAAQSPWKTDITSGGGNPPGSSCININFNQGSIVINNNGSGTQSGTDASKSGKEVIRQIIKHLNSESVHSAIRNGDKM